jgi:hypothetical protein
MYRELQSSNINPKQRHRSEIENYIKTTYAFIIINHLANKKEIINVMNALGKHVIDNYGSVYGYQNLDEFLIGQFLNVPLTYALLSQNTDYPITINSDETSDYEDIHTPWDQIIDDYESLGPPFTVGSASGRFEDIMIPWEEVTVPFDKIGWHNV